MARPEEMAQAMMNKWVRMREEGNDTRPALQKQKRPFLASQCEHLHDAEHWRRQILREMSGAISKIQNPGLGEHAIRDLNDEINKKQREKCHWNKRIKELGGPDCNVLEMKQQRMEGDLQSIEGSGGHRHFGAAKDLPGVKELFARQALKLTKRKRGDVCRNITPDCYGWRDEEDGVLLELEEKAMKKMKKEKEKSNDDDEEEDGDDGWGDVIRAAQEVVSTNDFVSQAVLERKKKALLERLTLQG